ncbi:MAG: Mg/Co/Ni transporter MgtE [Candidatus Pelagisphaera sp.]|jgi:Mg/Co/Ni transporter MgtE
MSESHISLSLAFLRSRPDAAAKTLEQFSPIDVSTFLSQIPAEYASLAIERMLPIYAARIAERLGSALATPILSRLHAQKIAVILRITDTNFKEEILNGLPKDQNKSCKSLLRYDEGLIGAWMNPQSATICSDSTVKESLNAIRNVSDLPAHGTIFVVDREGHLKGSLATISLLNAQPSLPIISLMNDVPGAIAARTLLQHASEATLWQNSDLLPVLNAKKRFVGTLSHTDLRKAQTHLSRPDHIETGYQLAPTLIEEYLHTLWALATSLIGEYFPKSRP